MSEEFNLSEKRQELRTRYINHPQLWAVVKQCDEQDKEFIGRLKDANMLRDCHTGKSEDYRLGFTDALIFMKQKIDKFAGKKSK